MAMQHLELLEQIFVGEQPIRFNRHNNILYIDQPISQQFEPGQWLIVDAYQIVDPDMYTSVWTNQWLKNYATALIKRQWGENLSKLQGMPMPGGVLFNGQTIKEEAMKEISDLEHELIHSFSLPVSDMIGIFLINILGTGILLGGLFNDWISISLV